MIQEIQARSLLQRVRQPDPWFGLKYNFNLYRGCQHQCIYCDSRSACYGIENFSDVRVKTNAIDLFRQELPRKRIKGTIGTGSMNDPYMPVEKHYQLTRQALEVIAEHRFPVHIITKSDLVLRDLDVLKDIARLYARVSFTITTADDELGQVLEPGAPVVSARLKAMSALAANGIPVGVTLMPVLPFIEDHSENIREIVRLAKENGAQYIIPWFGMSLRDLQRDYYYQKLDEHFPGLRNVYEARFRNSYSCDVRHPSELDREFRDQCSRLEIATKLIPWHPPASRQLELF